MKKSRFKGNQIMDMHEANPLEGISPMTKVASTVVGLVKSGMVTVRAA